MDFKERPPKKTIHKLKKSAETGAIGPMRVRPPASRFFPGRDSANPPGGMDGKQVRDERVRRRRTAPHPLVSHAPPNGMRARERRMRHPPPFPHLRKAIYWSGWLRTRPRKRRNGGGMARRIAVVTGSPAREGELGGAGGGVHRRGADSRMRGRPHGCRARPHQRVPGMRVLLRARGRVLPGRRHAGVLPALARVRHHRVRDAHLHVFLAGADQGLHRPHVLRHRQAVRHHARRGF